MEGNEYLGHNVEWIFYYLLMPVLNILKYEIILVMKTVQVLCLCTALNDVLLFRTILQELHDKVYEGFGF